VELEFEYNEGNVESEDNLSERREMIAQSRIVKQNYFRTFKMQTNDLKTDEII
jgi:hypothetical protein